MIARRIVVVGLVGVILAGACADDGPPNSRSTTTTAPPTTTSTISSTTTSTPSTSTSTTTTSTTSTTTTTTPPTTTTTIVPTAPRPALGNADGSGEAFSGIAQLIGFGGSCTAFLVALGPLDEPATALTNGHCVGIFDAATVIQDLPVTDAVLRFRLFQDTLDAVVTVPVTAIAYGSMRASDVAVLQLGATRRELGALPSYALGLPPAAGTTVAVVGVPASGIPADQVVLRGGDACTAGDVVRLVEHEWAWDAAIASDCAGILGGSSGSPMFAAGDATTAVGIVNTTTIGAAAGGSCSLGQPCEIGAAGVTEVPDRTYAMPLAAWAACWAPSFDIASAGCPAEQPPVVTVEAPLRAVRPGATWAASLANGGPDRAVLVKAGPASTTDCRDPAGYGDPQPAFEPRAVDIPLPDVEDVYLLCAARADADGAPSTADAGYAVMQVDATPPDAPIALSTVGDAAGLRVEPVVAPPEHSSFLVRSGPAGTVDCADVSGYAPYLGEGVVIAADQLPATVCVIGEDEAGNRSAPQEFPLL